MSNSGQLKTLVAKIADAIVEFVERADGPVTLNQIADEIPGFKEDKPERYYALPAGDFILWGGMTEAGCEALGCVLRERRVAVQFVSPVPYMLEGLVPMVDIWRPIVLLPVKAANLETPGWHLRASPGYQSFAMEQAASEGKAGFRLLAPKPMSFDTDQFAL